jgi:hypothetical protein
LIRSAADLNGKKKMAADLNLFKNLKECSSLSMINKLIGVKLWVSIM